MHRSYGIKNDFEMPKKKEREKNDFNFGRISPTKLERGHSFDVYDERNYSWKKIGAELRKDTSSIKEANEKVEKWEN